MHVTVCCSACRSDLIPYMLYCFEQQTHGDRSMVILDDQDALPLCSGDRWRVAKCAPCRSLGAKRNACAALVDVDGALVVWDDDDIFLPWALEATAAALERAEWSRPSRFCWYRGGVLYPAKTWGRPDRRDKAMQCGWGVTTDLFHRAGGYPDSLNVGEDMQLALRFEANGATECDPIDDLGYKPWYVWGPWGNQHVSDPRFQFGKLAIPCARELRPVKPPGIDMQNPRFDGSLGERGFAKQDWYEDATR